MLGGKRVEISGFGSRRMVGCFNEELLSTKIVFGESSRKELAWKEENIV